jgi:hypothetical protein
MNIQLCYSCEGRGVLAVGVHAEFGESKEASFEVAVMWAAKNVHRNSSLVAISFHDLGNIIRILGRMWQGLQIKVDAEQRKLEDLQKKSENLTWANNEGEYVIVNATKVDFLLIL